MRSEKLLVKGVWLGGFALALALVAARSGALAAPEAGAGAAEAEAMQVTQDACTAFRKGDLVAAERLLLPEFTLVGSSGAVQTRDECLAEIRSGDPLYELFDNVDMTAHAYGKKSDVVVVRGITRLKGVSGGKPFELQVRFTDVVVRTAEGWRIATSHATRLSPP